MNIFSILTLTFLKDFAQRALEKCIFVILLSHIEWDKNNTIFVVLIISGLLILESKVQPNEE